MISSTVPLNRPETPHKLYLFNVLFKLGLVWVISHILYILLCHLGNGQHTCWVVEQVVHRRVHTSSYDNIPKIYIYTYRIHVLLYQLNNHDGIINSSHHIFGNFHNDLIYAFFAKSFKSQIIKYRYIEIIFFIIFYEKLFKSQKITGCTIL